MFLMVLPTGELAAILDAMLEGLQVIGFDYRYLHLNATAARHGRSTQTALLGRTMMECYPGIEHTEVFARIRRCLDHRESHVLENEFTFPDGSSGWFELRIEPVPLGVCVLSIDISAQKAAQRAQREAEERLEQGQRMEAVGLLAAGAAHDFANLLTVVLGTCEVARKRATGPGTADLEAIEAAARQATGLVRKLLHCGRLSVSVRRPVDLAAMLRGIEPLLRSAVRAHAARVPIEFELRLPPEPVVAAVDCAQIDQIVLDLVLNACDAIDHSGVVTVELARAPTRNKEARTEFARITVRDNGVGMDQAVRTRVFEPFFTTKRGRGQGLGLATAYGVVRQHGGLISVRSQPGAGSTFEVLLPLLARGAAAVQESTTGRGAGDPRRDGTGPGTVLVAEDDPLVADLIGRALAEAGYGVAIARSGREALAAWAQQREAIAMLVTDMRLGDITGAELVERLRCDRAQLPVLCTSGYGDADLAADGGVPPGVFFVAKPFTPSSLLERVRLTLASA